MDTQGTEGGTRETEQGYTINGSVYTRKKYSYSQETEGNTREQNRNAQETEGETREKEQGYTRI